MTAGPTWRKTPGDGPTSTPTPTKVRVVPFIPASSPPCGSRRRGACHEVHPVERSGSEVLVHLRGRVVETDLEAHKVPRPEELSMERLAWVFADRRHDERGKA